MNGGIINQERLIRIERKVIGTLQSGEKVFERLRNHLHGSLVSSKILPEALGRMTSLGRDFFDATVEFEDYIGFSVCVETTFQDEITYAQREGRTGLTRFVKNREPDPSKFFTAVLKKIEDGYILITAYVGPKGEPETWDRNATDKSASFWKNHAIVWGKEEIVPGSEKVTA